MILTEAQHKSFGEIRRKAYDAKIEVKSISDADYTVEVVVTTVSIDREGEVVLPSAVAKRLAVYFLNPILLWGHKRRKGPKYALGACLALTPLPDGTGWVAKFRYDVEINPKAALVWAQIKAGTQRSWSISFLPWAWVTRFSSAEEINALPDIVRAWLQSGQCKVVYTDVEIIEISNVHVASNRDATLRSHEEQIEMKVNGDKPGVPVEIEVQTKDVASPVDKAAIKCKYHPKVNDITGRLRDVAYSLEGPGWDDYDSEKMPPPERVAACLDILTEILASMKTLMSGSAASEVAAVSVVQPTVSMAVAVPVTEKSVALTPEVVEPVVKAAEPAPPVAEPAPPVAEAAPVAEVTKSFDPVAFAAKYLDNILK